MNINDVKCLPVEAVRNELFSGGFRPMNKNDWSTWADADEGSLIATIKYRRQFYEVIFSPEMGNVQVFYCDDLDQMKCWEMDLMTGLSISL